MASYEFERRPVPSSWSLLGFAAGLILVATAGYEVASAEETKKEAAPEVRLEIVQESETVEIGESVLLILRATNSSEVDLEGVQLRAVSTRFDVERVHFPGRLPAFGSGRANLRVCPRSGGKASYGPRKILFVLDYHWKRGRRSFDSTQSAATTLNVRRRFEEEAGGLLGGSTALLYLLLPILPAYLAYQVAEGLRKGEGLSLPTLSQEHLLAAFFLAVSANVLFLLLPLGGAVTFDYSDPRTLAKILGVSVLLGVLVPGLRFLVGCWRMKTWGIGEDDSFEVYLKKALLASGSPRHFRWATAMVDGVKWEGVLLVQPNGRHVLGPEVQIGVLSKLSANDYQNARTEAVELLKKVHGGAMDARKTLVDRVEQRALMVAASRFIQCKEEPVEVPRFLIERQSGEFAIKKKEPGRLAVVPQGE